MKVVVRLRSIWTRAGFLTASLILCTIIVAINFAIGTIAPTTAGIDDEIWLIDIVWRTVQGQRVGIDYHDPLGFGLSQIGAVLWRSLGPYYLDNVLRLTQTVVGLTIAWCGCLVSSRAFNQERLLAYVFCMALSLVVSSSSPASDGWTIGTAMYFNHLIEGTLAVLFLQMFVAKSDTSRGIDIYEVLIAAFLLNILFLVKISGALVGLGIVFAGCLFSRPIGEGLKSAVVILLLFVAMLGMDFVATGLEVTPVLREYALAAQARATFLSPYFVALALGAWVSLGSITALLAFALSQRSTDRSLGLWRIGLIVGTYTVTLIAFQLTSSSIPSLIIATAAAMVLTQRHEGSNAEALLAWNTDGWRRCFDPAALRRISVIDSIPYVISGLVILPQIKASAIAFTAGMLVSFGLYTPIILGTGTGVSWSAVPSSNDYVASVNDGVRALSSLGATKLKIITLDFPNPFPALFQAPSPIGIRTWAYEFKPNAIEVLGDSCVVMLPLRSSMPSTTTLFVDVTRDILANQFHLIYQDEYWSIYRRNADRQECVSANSEFQSLFGKFGLMTRDLAQFA
jgi:hypothetical protein